MDLHTIADLPLLGPRETVLRRVLTWVLFISFPLPFLGIIAGFNRMGLLFLGLLAISAIILQIMRSYEIVGTIRLTKSEIVIENVQERISFPVSMVSKLKFTLLGVRGEFNRGRSCIMNQGADNYLQFRYMEEKKSYRFLMTEESVNGFRNVLNAWRKAGMRYGLHNGSWTKFPRGKYKCGRQK